jgi:RNA polymerase sigma factor for flagellar operon FliA
MSGASNETQKLIESSQGLVISLATKIARKVPLKVEIEDLVAYGEVGLAEAARDFDPQQGTRFTTFAYYRVRGAIYDGLAKMSWTSRARYRRLKYQQLANEALAEEASVAGANASLESEATWFRDVTEKLGAVYLASQTNDGQGIRDSTIEDPDAPSGPAIVAQREIVAKLEELVNSLSRPEQRLIREVYFEGTTLQHAADTLGISKSWASRMHARALDQLSKSLRRMGVENEI